MNKYFVLLILLVISQFSQVSSQSALNMQLLKKFIGNKDNTETVNSITTSIVLPNEIIESGIKSIGISDVVNEIDGIIVDSFYIVGLNDKLTISITGVINKSIDVIVDIEGNITITNVGCISVTGQYLIDVKNIIVKKLATIFPTSNIDISLTRVGKFRCYVLGAVKKQSSFIAPPLARVSDLIELAGGFIVGNSKIRGIEVHTINNTIRVYADIAKFENNNDIAMNPYLLPGDRVYVKPKNEIISVYGQVEFQGTYDYLDTDLLLDILAISGGLSRGADSTKIIINRFANDIDSLVTFELSLKNSSSLEFKIEPDDRIFVCGIPDYRKHREVTIAGEVKHPGTYPIRKDKTKLAEIISMAGGLTEDAYLAASKIVRQNFVKLTDREFQRLQNIPVTNMSPLERSYLKTKLTEEDGIVSLDFEKLFSSGSDYQDIVLRDGDNVIITRKSLSIKVTGAVVSPGLVSFATNKGVNYYIKQAGGYNMRAQKRNVTVIKGGKGSWLKSREVADLVAGDIIWVPEQPYRDRIRVTKEVIYIVGSMATMILSGFAISNYISDL